MLRTLRNNTFRIHRPEIGTRINWANPCTRGLAALFPVSSPSGEVLELISGRKFAGNNSPFIATYYRDGTLDCSSNNYIIVSQFNQINDVAFNVPATWCFRFMYDPTAGASPGIMSKSNVNSLATAGWNIGATGVNGNIFLRIEGAAFSLIATSTFNFASFQFYTIVITYDGGTSFNGVKFYINGKLDVTVGTNPNLGGIQSSDAAIDLQLGRDAPNNKAGSCKLSTIGIWKNRSLSPAEALFLSANIYSLFDPVSSIPLVLKLGNTPITLSKSDSLSFFESPSLLEIGRIITADGITLVDSVIIPTANTPITASEQLVFTDTLRLVLGKGYQNFDIMILLDQISMYSPVFFTKGETLSLTDIAIVYPVISRQITGDQLSFSDVATTLIKGLHAIVQTDALTINDLLALTLTDYVNLSGVFVENILITDAFIFKLINSLGVFSDTLTISDLVKLLTLGTLKENDSLNLSDFTSVSAPETSGLSDLFAVVDNASIIVSIILNIADTVQFTDVVTKSISGVKIMLQFHEGLTLTDDPTILIQALLTSYLRRYLNDVIH